jgi:hypothetical protein
MSFHLFAFVVLAGLVAAGAPRVTSSDDAGAISCTPLSDISGYLKLVWPGTQDLSLAVINDTLQKDTANENQQFVFENCTSQFMNASEDPSVDNGSINYYG